MSPFRLSALLALILVLAGCSAAPLTTEPSPATTAPPVVAGAVAGTNPAAVVPPTQIEIPSISAASTLIGTGLNPDGTAEVPPVDEPLQASYLNWDDSIELERPLVVYGHVNGRGPGGKSVPGVFAKLDQIKAGAEVDVTRADGTVEIYLISSVEKVSKNADPARNDPGFPTTKVYDIVGNPAIRLVTCGGDFDRAAGHYTSNVIAYGQIKDPV